VAVNLSPPLTLEHLQHEARPYPSNLLPKKGTALGLFAAGFHGWNDIVWFSLAGLQTTCVDVDGDKLLEMAAIYPDGWDFHVDDAWDFAEQATQEGRTWDVVSVDPFFGDDAPRAWDALYLWAGLARRLLTVTVKPDTHLNVPDGWKFSYFPRSGNAAWLVMTR
jgi:hypothetical protein